MHFHFLYFVALFREGATIWKYRPVAPVIAVFNRPDTPTRQPARFAHSFRSVASAFFFFRLPRQGFWLRSGHIFVWENAALKSIPLNDPSLRFSY